MDHSRVLIYNLKNAHDQLEKIIAKKLRSMCDAKRRETNPQQSAKLLQQLGRIYRRRCPDKFSLIRSCALFNAAILREPNNIEEVKTDLNELCEHVLIISGAKACDLVGQALLFKNKVIEMRSKASTALSNVNPIPNGVCNKDRHSK